MLNNSELSNETNHLISKLNAQKLMLKNQKKELNRLSFLLAESLTELEELYDFNSTIYITISDQYIIKRANFAAVFFLETDRRHLINTCILNFIALNSKSNLQKVVQNLLKNTIKKTVEIELISKSGERKQVQLDGILLPNQLIRLSLFDITRTRQLELQAFELEKKLMLANELLQHHQMSINLSSLRAANTEMAAALFHEINQPLTTIVTYSQACLSLIKNKFHYKRKYNKFLLPLEQISLHAILAAKIIKNMGRFDLDNHSCVEEIDINLLIKEAVFILKHELSNYKLKITLDLMNRPPKILANKMNIMQIILNLSRNSIEALKSISIMKPKLIFKTRSLENTIIVHVIDNGPGISPDFQTKIFHKYFTTKPQGAGLGLGICHSLIEELGGQIKVHNKKTNGAWFSFTLPIKN